MFAPCCLSEVVEVQSASSSPTRQHGVHSRNTNNSHCANWYLVLLVKSPSKSQAHCASPHFYACLLGWLAVTLFFSHAHFLPSFVVPLTSSVSQPQAVSASFCHEQVGSSSRSKLPNTTTQSTRLLSRKFSTFREVQLARTQNKNRFKVCSPQKAVL